MNEFLAQLYGTAENIGAESDDTTKLAQAEVMNQMFEAEGIDVDNLAPDTIVKVAEQIFGEDNTITHEDVAEDVETEKVAEAAPEIDDAEEKLAEADFLGRVMAHSYVDEMAELEKAAGAASKLKEAPAKFKAWMKKPGEAYKAERASGSKGMKDVLPTGEKVTVKGTRPGKIRAALRTMRKHKGQTAVAGGAGLAGIGAVGGTGYALGARGKKKESALDVLAEQRAYEMLEEAGYEFEPVDEGQDKLASAVEERAYEMLAEAGFISEE